MQLTLDDLNENQRRAVTWDKGPLVVLAGPGSGKTAVLALRVAQIIRSTSKERFRVLALTFTNKAAIEMRERVDSLTGEGRERALLTTFHSFAADVLRQHGSHIEVAPDFSILSSEEDRVDTLKDAINLALEDDKEVSESDVSLLPLLTNLIEKLVDSDDIPKRIRDPELARKLSLLNCYYRSQLKIHNALDFPLLIALACELLRKFPRVASHYRTIYPHVCVDEFQDTNFGQFELLQAIVGRQPSGLFVVADDDQSVYQWNGASPDYLSKLVHDYHMAILELPQNYRCPQTIIEMANRLIRFNPSHSKTREPLWGKNNGYSEPVRFKCLPTPEAEADWVASEINNLDPSARGACVVLGRTRTLVERVGDALGKRNVAFTLAVKKNDFVSEPLKWLHAMLRLANSRGDKEQLRKVSKSFYELEGVDLKLNDVIAASSALGGDLFRAWLGEALARKNSLDPTIVSVLKLASVSLADKMEYVEFVTAAFNWFDLLRTGDTAVGTSNSVETFVDYEEERAVWLDLFNSVSSRFGTAEPSLNLLLQEISLQPKQPPIPPDAVRCFTIHTAKGMEFDHVFLMGLAEDILPSYQSTKHGDTSREMEEERRSCFVAITRTRLRLTLTRSSQYFGYDKRPSRFLREMGVIAK
jgi:DNA helicase-2/ATP-dependent DNA helicase PcrA